MRASVLTAGARDIVRVALLNGIGSRDATFTMVRGAESPQLTFLAVARDDSDSVRGDGRFSHSRAHLISHG